MLRFADDLRVNLYREPIDFRCGIDTLAALVDDSMQMDPLAAPCKDTAKLRRRCSTRRPCVRWSKRQATAGHRLQTRIYRRIQCSSKKRPTSPSIRCVMPSLSSTATKKLPQTSSRSRDRASIDSSSAAVSVTKRHKVTICHNAQFPEKYL